MTVEEAVRKLDALGKIGAGDPDCDCENCEADRDLRAALDAPAE